MVSFLVEIVASAIALDYCQEPIFRGAKAASKLCLISNFSNEDKLLEALKLANIREFRRELKSRYIG